MKTLKQIMKEIAYEREEEHFEVLLESECSIGDFKTAEKLLDSVKEKYLAQFKVNEKNQQF